MQKRMVLMDHEKSDRIRDMFDSIAGRYNMLNRLMSFGRDKAWRRYVIDLADLKDGKSLLDVATGTGDIIIEAVKKNKNITAAGIDFSESMLKAARRRINIKNVRLINADALSIPFNDSSFDVVTSGFLMRNVQNIPEAFAEEYRVLRPGGIVICMDTTPPEKKLSTPFVNLYFNIVIPFLAGIISGNSSAYSYLVESMRNFKSADELKKIMEKTGFTEITYRKFMLGTIAVHSGKRP